MLARGPQGLRASCFGIMKFAMNRLTAVAVLTWLLGAVAATASEPYAGFRSGDRWAVVGDSITHSGSYHAWVWLYHLTRFPDRPLEVINCGIAGDTAVGGVRRFAWDIAPVGASVATVMFGMNDVGRHLYAASATAGEVPAQRRTALETYEKALRALVSSMELKGTRVVLVTPSPFDQTEALPTPKHAGVNDALAECGRIVHRIAGEKGLAVIDLHTPMTRLNEERQKNDPAFTLMSADRIHPTTPGHLVMAYYFLKSQQAPAEVSYLWLDGASARLVESRNGVLTDLRKLDGGLAFTWTAKALPFPGDASFCPAMAWVPFENDLNQEVLRVAALPAGDYSLKIDGTEAGRYSGNALAKGVSLAGNSRTPQYQQSLDVLRIVQQQRLHVTETARNIALVEHQCAPVDKHPYTLESVQPYYAPRLAQLLESQPPTSNLLRIYKLYPEVKPRDLEDRARARELAEAARRAAQPKPRRYELVRLR